VQDSTFEGLDDATGDVTQAEGIASCVAALRRVFDGFVLHRAESSAAPHRINAELMVNATYVLEPRVNEAARLGTMPAGTPIVSRSPLSLETGTTRLSPQGRNNRSGSPRGTAGGSPPRSRKARPRRSRS